MLEHGLDKVHAEELRERVLQHMKDAVLPNLVVEEDITISKEISKEPIVSVEDDNLFDQFGNILHEGCADMDFDKVRMYVEMHFPGTIMIV